MIQVSRHPLLCLILLIGIVPVCAFGQQIALPIYDGSKFLCIQQFGFGNALGSVHWNGSFEIISFRKGLRTTRSQIRRLSFRLESAARREASGTKMNRLSARLLVQQSTLEEIRECRSQTGDFSFVDSFFPVDPEQLSNACAVAGASPSERQGYSRIINGRWCETGDSPVVELEMFNRFGRSVGGCSGTVVAPRVVITAAHCLEGNVREVEVRTGFGIFSAERFAAHPDFDRFPLKPLEAYDVGVLVTKHDLPTRVVKIWDKNRFRLGERGVIAGFGLDEFGQFGELRAAPVSISQYSREGVTIHYSGNGDLGNTCNGDSGGPLFIRRGGEWILSGVTSNGALANCGPGDISHFANITDPSVKQFLYSFAPELSL